jgi:hypothetical protein
MIKHWSKPAYALFAILFIAVLCFSFLPIHVGQFGVKIASAATIESFTSTGTTYWICPAGVTSVAVLVVAGGGSGGYGNFGGGGGGAGGILYNGTYAVVPGGNYTVTVGAGGAVSYNHNGSNSFFGNSTGNLTAIGGGYGGWYLSSGSQDRDGNIGGSGGGGGVGETSGSGSIGSAGTTGQGNKGGTGYRAAAIVFLETVQGI